MISAIGYEGGFVAVSDLPTISVIVVNLNGRFLLDDCLDSLTSQDYPQDRVEIILVDNGSTDDSVPFVRDTYPAVRIVEAGRNLGFAGGSNLGTRFAGGEYLAFINNDARADRRWLRALVDALGNASESACLASKILDQDGKTIDFVGTAMGLSGRAYQIDEGMPAAPGYYDEPCELLAPCGGAMMIRRDLFHEMGGFDEDFFAYYEDVDLGWRLWSSGHSVLFVPQSIVYHKQHQTGSGFPVEQRYALGEVNALRTLIKNCEEKYLWQVLPFSLLMGVKRSLEHAGVDRERYRLGYPIPSDAGVGPFHTDSRVNQVATSFLVAIDQVAEEMPRLLEKRRRIQAARVRGDEEIFARFPMRTGNPIFPWRRYHVVQDQLATDLGIADALKPQHGSRLLIVSPESIGPMMTGRGIRAWEIACALSDRFDVILAAPGEPACSHAGMRVVGYETDDPGYHSLTPYLSHADAVLAMRPMFAEIPRLRDLGKPSIVDLYDLFDRQKLVESPPAQEGQDADKDLESTIHLRLEGSIGDFFICASERQRDFWLGVLLASGRINTLTRAQDPTLRALIDVVPFGMPAEAPQRQRAVLKGIHPAIGLDDKLLLWSGGMSPWFDPITLIDALDQVLVRRGDVKLYFAIGEPSDSKAMPDVSVYERAVAHCRELGLLDRHVFFADRIPYEERASYLVESDLGVSAHSRTLESHLTSHIHLLDCVWAGLPVVSTEGDPLSDLIAQRGLGRAVPPGRSDLMAKAVLEMLADGTLRDRTAEQSQAVRRQLAWTRCVEPIEAFLERVAFAPDSLGATRRAAEMRQVKWKIDSFEREKKTWEQERRNLQADVGRLQDHIEAIKQGRVMRLMRAINVALGRE
jgi:GT2 family glycosyltransferase/glycosyltransferase involved in cell wall biosynthesis